MKKLFKIGNENIIISEEKQTKALKMKSVYIMAETTHKALKEDKEISSAKMLDFDKVQELIEQNKKGIFKGATKFKVNILTEEGWRSGKFFGKDEDIDWYNPSKHYDDERAEIGEIYMIQILYI